MILLVDDHSNADSNDDKCVCGIKFYPPNPNPNPLSASQPQILSSPPLLSPILSLLTLSHTCGIKFQSFNTDRVRYLE